MSTKERRSISRPLSSAQRLSFYLPSTLPNPRFRISVHTCLCFYKPIPCVSHLRCFIILERHKLTVDGYPALEASRFAAAQVIITKPAFCTDSSSYPELYRPPRKTKGTERAAPTQRSLRQMTRRCQFQCFLQFSGIASSKLAVRLMIS